MPVIWGQQAGYLYLQLRDFKSGARKNPVMGPIAQTLSRDDMLALAEYFSKKPWPQLGQPPAPADVAATADAGQHLHRLHRLPSGRIIRARVRSRASPVSGANIWKARCWLSETARGEIIPACPI